MRDIKAASGVFWDAMISISRRLRLLIMLGFGCLAMPAPSCADDGLDTRVQRCAAATTTLDTDMLLYRTAEEASQWIPRYEKTSNTQEAFKVIQILAGQPEEALKYIKHAEPKVRTLGMLALFETLDPRYLTFVASLVNDTGASFSRRRRLQQWISRTPVPADPKSVGDIAMELIEPYLRCAGVSIWKGDADASRKLEKYLNEHRGPQFFGLWQVKWHRVSCGGTPVDESRYSMVSQLGREIDAVPSPEREIIKLKLWSEHAGEKFCSGFDLTQAARSLGKKPLLDLLAGKVVSTDPDLNGQETDYGVIHFLLEHATELLQPADAEWLLQQSQINVKTRGMAMWTIAASRLMPERAVSVLKGAIENDSESRADDLLIGLWKIGGAAETAFIVDRFYKMKGLEELNQSDASRFFAALRSAGVSSKPLLKAIIADARFERVGFDSLREAGIAANQLNKKLVIGNLRQIGPRVGKGGKYYKSVAAYKQQEPEEFARMVEGMKDWRLRLVATAEEW